MGKNPSSIFPAIQPWVIFRLINKQGGPSKSSFEVLIKDTLNGEYYELKGSAAQYWFLMDGSRTVEQIVSLCHKAERKRKQRVSYEIFEDLISSGIARALKKPQIDRRAEDMRYAFKCLTKHIDNFQHIKRKRPPKITLEKRTDERTSLLSTIKKFKKILPPKSTIKLKRLALPSYGERFYVCLADIHVPGRGGSLPNFGTAQNLESAATSSVCESIERIYSFRTKPDVYSKSYNDLLSEGHKALDPLSYKYFASDQEALVYGEVRNLTRKEKINWTLFEDACLPDNKILIPARINDGISGDKTCPYYDEASSNGCAVGADREGAKLRAALELIERDSLLFYWRTRNSPSRIDLSRPNGQLQNILDTIAPLKNKIFLFHLKTELKATAVQAVLLGKPSQGEPLFTSAAACRLDPCEAIGKALLELLYLFEGRRYGPDRKDWTFYGRHFDNSMWDLDDRNQLYSWYPSLEAYDFLFRSKGPKIHWGDMVNTDTGNTCENLNLLISDFKSHGHRLYFRDNTPSEISKKNLFVYRAFSPDLISYDEIHRFRHLGTSRYSTLAKRLGLRGRPTRSSALNPWPNPLP